MYEGGWPDPRYGFESWTKSQTRTELSAEQLARATQEERLAQSSDEHEEVAQHERRADKASYLRDEARGAVRLPRVRARIERSRTSHGCVL